MFIHYTLGAIFIIFILCVHCDNAANNNEVKEIHVPSAPQNLVAYSVTSNEILLSWAPPATFTVVPYPDPVPEVKPTEPPKKKHEPQSDAPANDVIGSDQTDLGQGRLKNDFSFSWSENKDKFDYQPSSRDTYRSNREVRSHRHRKRRQDNNTDAKLHLESVDYMETHSVHELPIEVVKKSGTKLFKDTSQYAYVLYYEQGVAMFDSTNVVGVQSSDEVKKKNVFSSDLGMAEYSRATKNLTLLNTSGKVTKVVGFRLKNLIPFTPYKIWARAFFNTDGVLSSSDLQSRLGTKSEELYVLTDVAPPSAPKILNLTCDLPQRNLYLQWRQPSEYNNSLDHYVVTVRKFPELQPRTRLTLPTNKNDIETSISVPVDSWNMTRYEVKIYAVTNSVAKTNTVINGSESPPEEVSSEWCTAHSEAMSPMGTPRSGGVSTAALLAVALVPLLAALALALVYWRCRSRLSKCISAAYNYLEEGGERAARAPLNAYKKPVAVCSPLRAGAAAPGAEPEPKPPRMASPQRPAVAKRAFPGHVARLHQDGDIGFSKEYEIVVTKSAALGHTSHHSHRPENRQKNRYLNITAYDHSRVCVSAGARCGAAGCVGCVGGVGRAAQPCDYVNANFIDGMLPALTPRTKGKIQRKLERRKRPHRQPSVKPAKPPPNLAEGIESAFLNIEFSGIVESDEANDSDSDRSDDDAELDDVYVDIDGAPTRVKLEWLVWRRRYIATQGPTPATLDAFWRMIWQHRVHTIVMITNLVERGRRKCDMYWPGGGRGSSAEYGGVHVTLLHEDVRAAYTVRKLRVRGPEPTTPVADGQDKTSSSSSSASSASGDGRSLVQFHYTVWPDHGTPRHPLAVLPFVRAAAQDPGTVLVHCSAGVGRTGTYIVLDAQLNQLKLTGTLSPLGFLCRARTQRNHLVQTEEQYVFVHDALLEHVRSGETDVEFAKAREYLAKLLEPISEEELAVMDLNPIKAKSVHDLTNGNEETTSLKSSPNECSEKEEVLENGSQMSIKTDELNSEQSKSQSSAMVMDDEQKDGMVNGDDAEGVYDLAPRSTDTYSKKMQAYNNMSESEKEEIRRANRAENYALLERMRSLANRHHTYQGPPPVNLLEKQFQLITRSCVEPSVCARAAHNADKNRPGGILPSDSARVMLVPKPGVEGSEYVNASWVCGRRRLREWAVAQHPAPATQPELWRLLWDHTAQLVLLLHDDPDCPVFWPTEEERELYVANFKASFVSKDTYVAYRKCDMKSPAGTPSEPETNGLRRQESRQESDCADDERLIPENSSPVAESEPAYRFDRTELRLERLSAGNRDLSTRKSIANGDLFSSFSEKKNGPKSPRSPSKMSLKNFKLSSPTKFKFPEWGTRAGSPPDSAPPPPPVPPSLSVEEEAELCRPCYRFQKVDTVPDSIPSDRVIEVINVSVHSLQDDYQLSVKFIRCIGWLEGDTVEYTAGRPDENEFVRAVRQATCENEREEAIDRLIEPYEDSFALIEFVAGSQMEYKNGPVVVVDKYGGWKAMTFCTLSATGGAAFGSSGGACGGASGGAARASLYCSSALAAHARCATDERPHSLSALLAAYSALAAYGRLLRPSHDRLSNSSRQESR